jgi:hypothetical protein
MMMHELANFKFKNPKHVLFFGVPLKQQHRLFSLFNKTNLCTIIIKHTKTLTLLKV